VITLDSLWQRTLHIRQSVTTHYTRAGLGLIPHD